MERRMQSTSKLLLLGVLLAGVLVDARVATALEVGEETLDFTLPREGPFSVGLPLPAL